MTAKTVVACSACGQKNRVSAATSGTPRCGTCHAALPWVVDAGDADFPVVADQASVPVLVDLWAPWCGPCRMVSPVLERLAAELAGRLKLVKVNVDEAPALARRFGAQSIPTLVMTWKGQELSRQVGALPPAQLSSWVSKALADVAATRESSR